MCIRDRFIYRRYPDYTVFESLRELKSKIASQLETAKQSDNIKTGPGGIREIEFIGQAFQLLRGGRDSSLQERGIVRILSLLPERNLLTAADAEILLKAYDYLRRLENRLQMLRDQQTHALPADVAAKKSPQRKRGAQWNGPAKRSKTSQQTVTSGNDLDRIAASMLLRRSDDLLSDLKQHREQVHRIFSELFRVDATEQDLEQVSLSETEIDFEDLLAQAGIDDAASIVDDIHSFTQGPGFDSLTEASQRRVSAVLLLLPELSVRACKSVTGRSGTTGGKRRMLASQSSSSVDAAETMRRLLAIVRRVAGRSGYLQILMERPKALELLARLVARSAWITDFILAQPIVIDELLQQRLQQPEHEKLPTRSDIEAESERLYTQVIEDDLDVQMDALRHFKLSQTMRTVIAWILERADVEEVSSVLTWTGESSLQFAAKLVEKDLQRRHGRPLKRFGKPSGNSDQQEKVEAEFAIVGYGKLGSMELGLGSDLDIIFLHDAQDDDLQTDGTEALNGDYYFSRLARKIVHFVTTLTPAGALYQIDTRLRPNGRAGMLVSSLDAFESYQCKQAWIWEHQALVRARVVVGSDAFINRFEQARSLALTVKRDSQEVAEAVSAMRVKMIEHQQGKDNGRFDYKHGAGAIVDIEFIVQFLVLTASHKHPQLLLPRDNVGLLGLISKLGLLDKKAAETLCEAYLYWRARALEQALLSGTSASSADSSLSSGADSGVDSTARRNFDDELSSHERELSQSVTDVWNSLLPASTPSSEH